MIPTLKLFAILSIFFLVGGLLGGVFGFSLGAKVVIKTGLSLVPMFTNITIDEQAINDAIFLYKNNIKRCIP